MRPTLVFFAPWRELFESSRKQGKLFRVGRRSGRWRVVIGKIVKVGLMRTVGIADKQ
jgi:hypothetical protein